MPYNDATGSFEISTFDQVMERIWNEYKKSFGYSGTLEEFKQGTYGAIYYGAVQLYIRSEIETSLIYLKATNFYKEQNAIIKTNSLNPTGIQERFMEELGYQVALDSVGDGYGIAIDYTPGSIANVAIAKLLATECYAYDDPSMMLGDIEQAYQKSENDQSFVMRWRKKEDFQVKIKVVITYVEDTPAPMLSKDEIVAKFYELFPDRYVWGNAMLPQRLLTATDLPFAASVRVLHNSGTEGTAQVDTPLKPEYWRKIAPALTVNDIEITEV